MILIFPKVGGSFENSSITITDGNEIYKNFILMGQFLFSNVIRGFHQIRETGMYKDKVIWWVIRRVKEFKKLYKEERF